MAESTEQELVRATVPPKVQDDDLHWLLQDTHHWGSILPIIGDGKTATALALELDTGETPVGRLHPETGVVTPIWHPIDVVELLTRARRIAAKETLNDADRTIVMAEAKELWDVLQLPDSAGVVTEWAGKKPARLAALANGIKAAWQDPAISAVTGAVFETAPHGRRVLQREATAPLRGFAAEVVRRHPDSRAAQRGRPRSAEQSRTQQDGGRDRGGPRHARPAHDRAAAGRPRIELPGVDRRLER